MTRMRWAPIWFVVAALSSAGCSATGGGEEILVSAAASLTDAFTEIESAYETANPGIDVVLNFAGSSALREQILAGAPVAVFASADPANMASVVAAGAATQDPVVFATNTMQIATPVGNPGEVTGVEDFAAPELLIGLCAVGVPCGDLARRVLANAGVSADPDTTEPDVRSLLTKIGAGELDAGIVYATDVLSAKDEVDGIVIGRTWNVTAEYPIVALEPDGRAADFVAFVTSATGSTILAEYGFGVP